MKLLRRRLERSFSVGISQEAHSYGLLRSHVLWNGGTRLPIPEERIRFLHETQEIKHPRFRGSPRQTYARKPEKSETKRLDGEIEPRVSEA